MGKIAQVFCGAKTDRNNQRIQIGGTCFTEWADLSACNSRRLNQDISAFRQRLTGKVINDIRLGFVRGETDRFCAVARQRQQRQNRLMNFRTIVNPATAQYHANLFHPAIPLEKCYMHIKNSD